MTTERPTTKYLYEYRCVLVRVIDGDTVDLDVDLGMGVWRKKLRVRLLGINAPETNRRASRNAGIAAKNYLKLKLGPPGTQLMIRTHKDKTGKYGRYLAEIWSMDVDETVSVNEMMVQAGHAVRSNY